MSACTAYAYRASIGWCWLYGTGIKHRDAPPGWSYFAGTGSSDDIVRVVDMAVDCYRKGGGTHLMGGSHAVLSSVAM